MSGSSSGRNGVRKPARLRLINWAVSEAHPASRLPTLDPDGLYAASILQARRGGKVAAGEIELELQAPSTLLHDRIPCLEDAQTGVVVADSLETIESYSRKLAGKHAERDLLCEWQKPDEKEGRDALRLWAGQKAVEQLILLRLHPLVHQVLFCTDLFSKHTAHVYGSSLGFIGRRSTPHRLKRQIQTTYASLSQGFASDDSLGAILREGNSDQDIKREEDRQRNDIVGRAGLATGKRQATGLLEEEKEKAWTAFREVRLRTCAEGLLGSIANTLGDRNFVSGREKACLLDLRLFSLLAPLLLPGQHFPALAESTLPTLLRSSYPTLVQHTKRVQALLWSVKVTARLDGTTRIETPDWPLLPNRGALASNSDEPLSLRAAHTMGWLTSEAYVFASRVASKATTRSPRQTSKPKTDDQKPAASAAEERESRMVRIGTYAWVATSLLVAIGTAFASGLVRIEIKEDTDLKSEHTERIVKPATEDEVSKNSDTLSEVVDEEDVVEDDDDDEMLEDEEEETDLDEEESFDFDEEDDE